MGKSNTEQLQIARKYLGQGGAKFRKYCGLPSGAAWCDAFVTYIFNEAGNASLFCGGKKQTYCPTTIKLCAKSMAQIPMYLAMPSDVIFFDWERNGVPNHIGFVRSKVSTSTINTTEGNTSNKVMDKTRLAKYVQAIFRPAFKGSYKIGPIAEDSEMGYSTIANLQKALGGLTIDGILGIGTVKRIQAYCNVSPQDGAWGPSTSKGVQRVICGFSGKDVDGAFGPKSVLALQKWVNAKNKATPVPTPTPTPTPKPTVPQGYGGTFPDLVTHTGQKIAYTARDLAYAKGTKKATYTYPKGKAKGTFTSAINKVFPKRSSWSKQCQAGASCDVGAATIIRFSGADTGVPRGLSEQLTHFKKSSLWKKTGLTKCSKAGDVAMHPSPHAHIWIGLGDGNLAEANHTWKYFEHITKDSRKINSKGGVYRCTKAMPIKRGDRGTEVTKLQNFLNWFGNYALKPDGDFGAQTELAVKNFQSKVGLTADGIFGNGSLQKAKEARK